MMQSSYEEKKSQTTTSFDWEHVKKEYRRLNTNIESLISSVQNYLLTTSKQFSDIQSSKNSISHSESSFDIPKNVVNCFNQIKSDIDELEVLLKKCLAFKQLQPSQMSIIKRYKEILDDQKKEFRRIQNGIQQNSDKMKLFAQVQLKKDKDLETYDEEEKLQQDGDDLEQHKQNAVSLNKGLSTSNSIIQIAQQVRSSLNFQTNLLSRANQQVENMNKQIPGMGDLVNAIKRAKHRRVLIYYAVIIFCMIIITYQVISSRK
ncbi:SNAP receptor complex protein, putative (macronuclear) [Tetrahymena thermophila SB210]|uniref:SNAP receptor complex protein, putative n=1 Tax=Tetrahymena thermophila (strain SB210) TaxID=312017 RepID=I7MCV8_TETTS|nr:SNAP receptor complex protein, putative [Tetrahymena thermophila SB210]EAR85015.3 SNAP receptor complex protein, putative [Tetrahymena thermophila SB210]|eukprot:XP_001032678.3 SNAP receptor complex protein, putative [Tetrahymena thermophila SB210]